MGILAVSAILFCSFIGAALLTQDGKE